MDEPSLEQFGITKEQFDSIISKKMKMRNYTFGICSAAGILAGSIFGLYISDGVYETVLFFLFFGCFLGSILGGVSTIILCMLFYILMYIFSPVYRSSKHYLDAKKKN
jgi:hypothetical protein